MRKLLLFILTLFSFSVLAQDKQVTNKTTIQDFGTVYTIDNPDLLLRKDKVYKVIFDIYTDSKDPEKVNPLLNTVARFINMHTKTGVPIENLKIVIVMHGKATKNVLNSKSFKEKFEFSNPNEGLLTALKAENVETFVCGQSYAHNNFKADDLNNNVEMALSALTVLVEYQSEGYQLINFN